MKAAYILLAILWGVYFSFHSLLARQWVKQKVYPLIPARPYRLTYNVLALAGLLALLYLMLVFSGEPIYAARPWLYFVALGLVVGGIIIIRLCFRQYNWKQFAGLEKEEETAALETGGLLQYVRHPMYAGTLLVLAGLWLFLPTTALLVSCLLSVLYIFIGIQFEERSLIEKYGAAYQAYKKRVPMLVPFLKKRGG